MKPLAIDLYCGLGGWAEGFLAEGYEVIGFDIERHDYGTGGYPGRLVLQDVLSLHGSQFRNAVVIVASPPCQAYSYRAMPWKRAKALPPPSNELLDACFRIQREASEAAGRYIPLVVENVKGAQPWVGRAAWHYGSYYLWGDVPALMPPTLRTVKVNGFNFHQHEKTGKGGSFQSAAVAATKNAGGSWFGVAHNTESGLGQNPVNGDGIKQHGSGPAWFDEALDERRKQVGMKRPGRSISAGFNNWPKDETGAYVLPDGTKVSGDWFGSYAEQKARGTISPGRLHGSRSTARKAASAQIAKIPFPLAQWIAHVYKPTEDLTSLPVLSPVDHREHR